MCFLCKEKLTRLFSVLYHSGGNFWLWRTFRWEVRKGFEILDSPFFLPAASSLIIIEERVVIISQTVAEVCTFPQVISLAAIMLVILPVALGNLGRKRFSKIYFKICNLCQFKLIEHFIVTLSLIAAPGEDTVIVLNIDIERKMS